jgi:hypothetical protein
VLRIPEFGLRCEQPLGGIAPADHWRCEDAIRVVMVAWSADRAACATSAAAVPLALPVGLPGRVLNVLVGDAVSGALDGLGCADARQRLGIAHRLTAARAAIGRVTFCATLSPRRPTR